MKTGLIIALAAWMASQMYINWALHQEIKSNHELAIFNCDAIYRLHPEEE